MGVIDFTPPRYAAHQDVIVTYDDTRPYFSDRGPVLDHERRLLIWRDMACRLQPASYILAEYLIEHPGFVRTYSQIRGQVSDRSENTDAAVVHDLARRTRRHLRKAFGVDRWLDTVRGVGLRWQRD